MISSMTGFGRASRSVDGREMTVELKSVNHRYLDISYRMPRHISFLEEVLRPLLQEKLARGHVDVYISYANRRNDAREVRVDEALLAAYLSGARKANRVLKLQDDLTLSNALRLPNVTEISEAEEDREAVCALARETLLAAAEELKGMRAAEGERLFADLRARADTLRTLRTEIAARAPRVVEEYRTKLLARIEALLVSADIDRQRLATEVALFADKASIEEELVRLQSHIAQYCALLAEDEPVGRKLDFIVQEMNREFNTIGSKASDTEIVNLVLSGKAEIEKIREQIQNIE